MLKVARSLAQRGSGCRALCSGRPTLNTPFVSDTVPLPEGRLGTVEALFLDVGATVAEDVVIAVVETDKITMDIKANASGVVSEVLVSVGDEVKET